MSILSQGRHLQIAGDLTGWHATECNRPWIINFVRCGVKVSIVKPPLLHFYLSISLPSTFGMDAVGFELKAENFFVWFQCLEITFLYLKPNETTPDFRNRINAVQGVGHDGACSCWDYFILGDFNRACFIQTPEPKGYYKWQRIGLIILNTESTPWFRRKHFRCSFPHEKDAAIRRKRLSSIRPLVR